MRVEPLRVATCEWSGTDAVREHRQSDRDEDGCQDDALVRQSAVRFDEQHRELGDRTREESDDAIEVRVGHDFIHDHGAGKDCGRGSYVDFNDHDLTSTNEHGD